MKRALKKIPCLILALILVCAALSLSACRTEEENAEIQAMAEELVDAIIAGRAEDAFALLDDTVSRDEFDAVFPEMCALVDGVKSYTFMQTGWNSKVDNGLSSYTATYLMTADNGREFQVQVNTVEGAEGIAGFNVAENK